MSDATKDYLDELGRALEDFSAESRADILAEIESHVEDLESADIKLEMGSPDQLASAMRREFRPKRFQDFLFAIIPTLFLFPLLNMFFVRYFGVQRFPIVATFIEALIAAGLVGLIALFRSHSAELQIYWHVYALIHLFKATVLNSPLVGRTSYVSSYWLLIPLGVLLLVVGISFGRILRQHRADTLLITFGLLPFAMVGVTMITNILVVDVISITQFGGRMMPIQIANYLATICVLALIFLPMRRTTRWMGLVLNATVPIVTTTYLLFPHMAQPIIYTVLIAQLMIPILGWRLDQKQRNPYRFA